MSDLGTDSLMHMIEQHERDIAALRAIVEARGKKDVVNPLFTASPQPEPVFPPPYPEVPRSAPQVASMPPIERWNEVLFKPGMAAAMLYVLMPAIESVASSWASSQEGPGRMAFDYGLLADLSTWARLTVAQRQALTELFRWVDSQLASAESVIPQTILANIAAAAVEG